MGKLTLNQEKALRFYSGDLSFIPEEERKSFWQDKKIYLTMNFLFFQVLIMKKLELQRGKN